jgi:hypothetical protein
MSGQLVGEVIDALEAGLKLKDPEKLILLAIAEKCQKDRRGYVRKGRLVAAVGQSQRTTERYLSVLVKADVVVVVQRGLKVPGRDPQAPLYELPPIMVAEANSRLSEARKRALPPSRVAEAEEEASATQVAEGASAKSESASAKSEGASATPPLLTSDAATIDGTNDGTNDGKETTTRSSSWQRKSAEASAPVTPSNPPRQGATGDDDDLLPVDPAAVDAVVKILRTKAPDRMTVPDVHRILYGQPLDSMQDGPTRDALDRAVSLGLAAVERNDWMGYFSFWALPTEEWQP